MNRRKFLKTVAVGSAAVAFGQRPALGAPVRYGKFTKSAAQRELGEHRIAKMEVRRVQDRFSHWVGPNSRGRPPGWGGGYQIRILTTDNGVSGWGMSHWKPEELKQLIGAKVGDLFDIEKGTADDAWKLDKLLYDLAGNILTVPTYVLLGDNGPKAIPIYTGSIYMEDVWPQDKPKGIPAVLRSCKIDYDLGYRAFKLKMGRSFQWLKGPEGLQRDVEVTRAVRERFGDCKILVDANNGWSVDEACEYVKGAADCDLYIIEEPFQEEREGLKKLKEAMTKGGSKAMICEGEMRNEHAKERWRYGGYSKKHVETLYALAAEKLVDVINLDLGIVGFTNWRRIMPELVKAGVTASPHTWMWTPRPYYSAQLGAGCGNVCIIEGIPGTARGIDFSAYEFDGKGNLLVGDAPGFGLKLRS